MDRPLEIAFHNMPGSAGLENTNREHVQKLEQIYKHIVGCRVAIIQQKTTHMVGDSPEAHINVQVPGQELVVSRRHSRGATTSTTIHHAFEAMAFQLREYKARRTGHVKRRVPPGDTSVD